MPKFVFSEEDNPVKKLLQKLRRTRLVELDNGILKCPGCGELYLHQTNVEVFARENYEDGQSQGVLVVVNEDGKGPLSLYPNSNGGNPSPRRNGLTIEFTCEICTASPKLAVYQHKGNTIVEWR